MLVKAGNGITVTFAILTFDKVTNLAFPSHISFANQELMIGNYAIDPDEDIHRLTLQPYEARVYRLTLHSGIRNVVKAGSS